MVTDQEGTVWSGSVDFTVRQWKIGAKGETKIKKGCYVSPGYEIHGHKNRVNCLLKVAESGRQRRWAELRALKRGHLGACSVRRNWYRSLSIL